MQISRIFGAETTILRAFQTFLRLSTLEKLRAPKDLIPDTIRFFDFKNFFLKLVSYLDCYTIK